jgi:hypothetical protein
VSGYLLMSFFVSFISWILILMMFARTARPATTSASSGESPAGRSDPQPASSTTAGGPAAPSAAPPSPPMAAEARGGAPEADAAPQNEVTPPAVMGGASTAATALGATAEAPSAEPAVEEAAAMAEAATADVAEAPSSGPQPAQEDVPEVVYGRHLLPNPVKVPLPHLLVKAHRAMEEAEAGFRQEWEELEAEHLRLSDWERHLGNRIQVVEREVQHENIRRVIDREMAVARREKAAIQKVAEVELKERSAHQSVDAAKTMAKLIDDERAILKQQEVAVKEGEAPLAALQTDMEVRTQDLKERESKVEEFLAEQRAGVERIVKWVGEASTSLEPLGLSPIQVTEAPSFLSVVLPALDSAADRLQRLESTLVGRLEAEGQELARVVVGYVLTCFRSDDPAISLNPVLVGPVPEAEAAAREGVQEAVEIVATRFERFTGPDLQKEEAPPDHQ